MSPRLEVPLLAIQGLTVGFPSPGGFLEVVQDFSFAVARGEVVGLVGESGSGKSLTALSILGLVPQPGRITAGRILLDGENLTAASPRRWREVRGARVAMVFQEPTAALDPVFTIGYQIAEAVRVHRRISRREAMREAVALLERVALPDPARRARDYPHQLSGGQCQRAMIAMALAGGPELLLADEPTTALDVTVQAQILALLLELRRDLGLAVLLITHDLGVVARVCDRVVVLYAGREVEEAEVGDLFALPRHPYSRALLATSPRLGSPAPRGAMPIIPGRVPEPRDRPTGCVFHPRCDVVFARCREEAPPLYPLAAGRRSRCFLADPATAPAPPGEP